MLFIGIFLLSLSGLTHELIKTFLSIFQLVTLQIRKILAQVFVKNGTDARRLNIMTIQDRLNALHNEALKIMERWNTQKIIELNNLCRASILGRSPFKPLTKEKLIELYDDEEISGTDFYSYILTILSELFELLSKAKSEYEKGNLKVFLESKYARIEPTTENLSDAAKKLWRFEALNWEKSISIKPPNEYENRTCPVLTGYEKTALWFIPPLYSLILNFKETALKKMKVHGEVEELVVDFIDDREKLPRDPQKGYSLLVQSSINISRIFRRFLEENQPEHTLEEKLRAFINDIGILDEAGSNLQSHEYGEVLMVEDGIYKVPIIRIKPILLRTYLMAHEIAHLFLQFKQFVFLKTNVYKAKTPNERIFMQDLPVMHDPKWSTEILTKILRDVDKLFYLRFQGFMFEGMPQFIQETYADLVASFLVIPKAFPLKEQILSYRYYFEAQVKDRIDFIKEEDLDIIPEKTAYLIKLIKETSITENLCPADTMFAFLHLCSVNFGSHGAVVNAL